MGLLVAQVGRSDNAGLVDETSPGREMTAPTVEATEVRTQTGDATGPSSMPVPSHRLNKEPVRFYPCYGKI
ncbi:uncharacterized protein A4U43_C10F6260 [Asparagus officinalis]|uniref:Uncharacterized protein n=1 Tax=Asparagus officinalis TaxID=4686 RepID=A0A5P1E5K1_ASPOF|nr:uncharacterized protein A4U43_C10F6260 [Asparagus officinalis]